MAVEPRNETLPLALWSAAVRAPWLRPVLVGEPIQLEPFLAPADDPTRGRILPFMQQGLNAQENTNRMMLAACEDPEVTDPFVWSNDDIYFMRETSLDDIRAEGSTALKRLDEYPEKGFYNRQAHLTLDLLTSVQRPGWSYERHVPIVVHKQRMMLALAFGGNLSPRSTYQNLELDAPAFIRPDVKVFTPQELPTVLDRGDQFLSTGSKFPIDVLERAVGFAAGEEPAALG